MGGVRAIIAKMDDPSHALYLVIVDGHMLMLDRNGKTIVDTAPRLRDARRVIDIKAVWKS